MLKSIFGLTKTNQGKFKSDKQKAFMLAKAIGYVYQERQVLQFGEATSAFVEWTVVLSDHGVERIVKTTSKAQIVWWENTPEHLAKVAKEQNERNASKLEDLKIFYKEANEQLEAFKIKNKTFLDNFDVLIEVKENILKDAPEEMKKFYEQDIVELKNKKEFILNSIIDGEANLEKVLSQINQLQ